MVTPSLSEGAIGQILSGEHVSCPVLQILAHKSVPPNPDPTPRHRFLLSDGKYSHQCCILTGPALQGIEKGDFDRFTVIQLNKYLVNGMSNKKIIIMLEPSVVARGSEVGRKLGNPVAFVKADVTKPEEKQYTTGFRNDCITAPVNERNSRQSMNTSSIKSDVIIPISQVNPYQNRWTIKGRVISKSGIRSWSNAKGEGTLFNFSLKDDSGEIRSTAFKSECEKYFPLITVGKVLYLSKAQVKGANRKFSDINHDYELTLNSETIIEFDDEVPLISENDFNFVKIEDMESVTPDSFVDAICVIHDIGEVSTIVGKASQKEFRKRDISLVDDSEKEIRLTLWNDDAVNFNAERETVVAIKKAKISDFNGRSLTSVSNTTLMLDPNLQAAKVLKGWYERKGSFNPSKLSNTGQTFDNSYKSLNYFTKEAVMAAPNQILIGTIRAFITQIGRTFIYPACPDNCKKKLIDLNNGFFKCDKCNKEVASPEPRAILSVCVSDPTGSFWLTLFHDEVEKVLGVDVQHLSNLKNQNQTEFDELISSLNFRSFTMKIRSKIEHYREEASLRHSVISVSQLNLVDYSRKLIERIRELDV